MSNKKQTNMPNPLKRYFRNFFKSVRFNYNESRNETITTQTKTNPSKNSLKIPLKEIFCPVRIPDLI